MTNKPITLYAFSFPSRAERIIWALAELKLEYELIRLDPFKGEMATDEFKALNVPAKMPVLKHGDECYTESLAIMEYLATLTSNELVPSSGKTALNYRHAMYFGATEIEPYLWIANQKTKLEFLYPWPDGTREQSLENLKKNLPTIWQWLDSRPYIAGDSFSMADIYYHQLLRWVQAYKIDTPETVEAYLQTLESRPAFPADSAGSTL